MSYFDSSYNVAVVSNISLELVIKKLQKKLPDISIRYYFGEPTILLFNDDKELSSYDVVVIFIDAYFSKYTKDELLSITSAVREFGSKYNGKLIISNFFNGFRDGSIQNSIGQVSESCNLTKQLLEIKDIQVLDLQYLITTIGINNAYQFTIGHLYQMPYTKIMIEYIADELNSMLYILRNPAKKVIVIDCDNTLWGGIIGEDHISEIKCDLTKEGIIYWHFQKFIKIKLNEGFILCICSKNNEADLEHIFTQKDMPLKFNDFVIKKINWLPKYENLIQIATELNLGLESIIFIDDSKFELESIKSIIPEISCIHFSSDYSNCISVMDNWIFRRLNILSEDSNKTEQYQTELKRSNIKNLHNTFEEYIEHLQIKCDFFINHKNHLARYSQLTSKTNQFNFNKQSLTEEYLQTYIDSGNYVIGLKVTDKFGDYGIVGLCLIDIDFNNAIIRNFLLSCRVLGRGVENTFFDYIIEIMNKHQKVVKQIDFVKTEKNAPAEKFYQKISK